MFNLDCVQNNCVRNACYSILLYCLDIYNEQAYVHSISHLDYHIDNRIPICKCNSCAKSCKHMIGNRNTTIHGV